ncbi:hypothetical protein N431DRAFT_63747 [Stipitochalara longipes BDJ]|nr:hypothetical protein N431DRAFT_63747 [Stipitochalara longipes BDJ]
MAAAVHHGLFQDLDDKTAELIYQLLFEDSEQLMNNDHGESVLDPDVQFAMQLVREEAERIRSILRDHQVAELIGQGVDPDEAGRRFAVVTAPAGETGEVESVADEERTATGAHNNDNQALPNIEEAPGAGQENFDYRLTAQEAELWGNDGSTFLAYGELEIKSTTSNNEEVKNEMEIDRTRCTSCMEMVDFSHVVIIPCGHEYCQDCLQDLFNRSFIEEELFPPRCCKQPIPLESIQTVLKPEMEQLYHSKKVEFESKDRTYCSNTECLTFLPPDGVKDGVAECLICQTRTCTLCKTSSHEGDCPEDENGRLLEELAAQEGWQSCPGCHRLVELTIGCYHMICLCRVHFCYLCQATPWKSCECPQWDDERLYDRAAEAVNAQNGGARAAQPPALLDIHRMADQLEGRHNCQHTHFRSLRGTHECQMCHESMPEWVYDCQQCHLQLCRRCRRNRL